jgi:hypothetical protein
MGEAKRKADYRNAVPWWHLGLMDATDPKEMRPIGAYIVQGIHLQAAVQRAEELNKTAFAAREAGDEAAPALIPDVPLHIQPEVFPHGEEPPPEVRNRFIPVEELDRQRAAVEADEAAVADLIAKAAAGKAA